MLYFGTGSMIQAIALLAGVGVWCINPCLSRDRMHQTMGISAYNTGTYDS